MATIFEDPASAFLKKDGLGEVTGGGTQLGEDGVEFCDLEIMVPVADQDTLDAVAKALDRLGAPKGSKLLAGGREVPFGQGEGLVLYLNGVDLPDEVYATCDVDTIVEEVNRLMGARGKYI